MTPPSGHVYTPRAVSSSPSRPNIAIVHDYLTQRGGAERVVLALQRTFPAAAVHTSLHDPDATYPDFANSHIVPSVLNRVAALRENHRVALPFLAPTFSAMKIDAETVICSSSGWAHGARVTGRKIVYCYAPARWLYQHEAYLATSGRAVRTARNRLAKPLRRWDQRAVRTADAYLAISTRSASLIRDAYGIEAEVVFPPHDARPEAERLPIEGLEPGYFLCVSRLLAYKNVDAVIGAFADSRARRLVVVGAGPDEAALRALASPNVSFLSGVADEQLRWLYANAAALVAASYEDFGLTPVEAAAFGTPSIVLRFGGYLDTVVEGETGLFFDEPTPAAIRAALDEFEAASFDADAIAAHAENFSEVRFADKMRHIVAAPRTEQQPATREQQS